MLRSRPIFGGSGSGSGSDPSKIKRLRSRLRLRLRLLVNCKAENYEFVTTKKKLFSSLIQNYRIYMFDFRNNFLYQGRKQGFGSAFFCGSGSGSGSLGYPGEGGGGKGKKWFFFSFFFTFQMILNIAHLLLYKIMIYSFLSLPFWPGSGSANLCGSGSETLEENNFF